MTPEEAAAIAPAIEFMRVRKRAYQLVFASPAGQEVMADFKKFCRGDRTCFHPDARMHAALEGRREVWQRIQDHLELSPEDLAVRYGATAPNKETDYG